MRNSEIQSDVKLSVAVITYNQEKTISRTLDSILGQEHDYICEVVVGDDCSSDGTRDILRGYAARYPDRVRLLLNEKNLGVGGNYFNVIAHCQGEYIMECAGDDWWLPGKVALQVPYLDARPECGMCYTDAACVYGSDPESSGRILRGQADNTYPALLISDPVPAVTIAMRSRLVARYLEEIRPEQHDWKMEDYPMWLWFARHSRIDYIPVRTCCYRVLQNTVSHSATYLSQLRFLQSVSDVKLFYCNRYPDVSDELHALVQSEYHMNDLQIGYILNDSERIARSRAALRKYAGVGQGWAKRVKLWGLLWFPGLMMRVLQYKFKA